MSFQLHILEQMQLVDIPHILAIERASFPNPWRSRDFEYALARENGMCRVARLDGEIAGYAVGFLVDGECHLSDFAIEETRRRQGLGRAVLDLFLDELKGRETDVVTLEARYSNQAAARLYGGAGFQTVAIRKGYYSEPEEDALVMVLPLRESLSEWVARAAAKSLQSPDNP